MERASKARLSRRRVVRMRTEIKQKMGTTGLAGEDGIAVTWYAAGKS